MTPERWKETEALYHAARERPAAERAAFLAAACREDEALRREVESLLNEPVSDGGFIAGPSLPAGVHRVEALAPAPMTGRILGTYDLQGLLGAGGMGEVYRARDTKLGRDVAIKILPHAFTSNPDRLARFEREARMLASLNHPNICAIYGLEEADGIRLLILELVEGETLAERLAHGGLSVAHALSFARQIAEALELAHDKGIVHRDLKPANIKITPEGVVKVLDFGLAKAVDNPGSTPGQTPPAVTHVGGRHGVVLGTAAYMSPEQARGLAVDKRTDIWAFGCVLYEMLTGRLTFPGDTVSDTIAKILEREPDWAALPDATPVPIRRLLARCLAKDPKQRLRDIGDVRIEIDTFDEAIPGASGRSASRPASIKARRWLPWAALTALVVGFGAWQAWQAARRPASVRDTLAGAQFTRFTDWDGTEGGAEISPDGRFVAFLADRDGQFDIWLSQVGTGRFTNLTSNIPPLDGPRSDRLIRTFGFSADGAGIWFSASGDAGSPKMLIPLSGGPPRALLGKGDAAPSWSADGTRLAYFNNGNGDPLFVADRMGEDPRQIPVAPDEVREAFFKRGMHNHNPIWSPDGEWIYFAHGLDPTVEMDLWRVRAAGGSPERITHQYVPVNFAAPLDAHTVLYVARANDWSGPWLWTLDLDRQTPERVVSGIEHYTSVAASHDGRRVVATVARPSAGLWQVPLMNQPAEDRDARPYPLQMMQAMAPRFGGRSLFFVSALGAGDGLWRIHDGEMSEVWTDVDAALAEPPAVSADGLVAAVVTIRKGKRHLAVMSSDGTQVRTLAASIDIRGSAGQASADWSPDGKWIAIGGSDANGPGLFTVPVNGGKPVRLVTGQATNPVWSPDGRLIVYSGPLVGGVVPLLGVQPDGVPVKLTATTVAPGAYRFLPDGKGLVYLPRRQSLDFWLLDLATSHTRALTRFSDQGYLGTFDVTPDGQQIVFDRLRENSDIVLIDLPK